MQAGKQFWLHQIWVWILKWPNIFSANIKDDLCWLSGVYTVRKGSNGKQQGGLTQFLYPQESAHGAKELREFSGPGSNKGKMLSVALRAQKTVTIAGWQREQGQHRGKEPRRGWQEPRTNPALPAGEPVPLSKSPSSGLLFCVFKVRELLQIISECLPNSEPGHWCLNSSSVLTSRVTSAE